MLREILVFYLRVLLSGWKPLWLKSSQPDAAHFHRRRYTKAYRARRRIVKNLWISSGLIMLCIPVAAWIVGLGLFTTFISLMILDESA